MEAARADVLGLFVHVAGELRDAADGVGTELEHDALRREQRLILLDERVLRLGEDALEVLLAQALELDADRETPLELGDEVGGLRHVKRARRDEEHVVGLHRAVFRRDLRALDDGQDVALHALAGDIRAGGIAVHGDLIDLVEEDDAAALRDLHGCLRDLVHVDELAGLLLCEDLARLLDADLALSMALRHEVAEHVLEVVTHALEARAREHADHRTARLLDVDLDELLFELAVLESLANPFAACLVFRLLFLLLLAVRVLGVAEEAAERIL